MSTVFILKGLPASGKSTWAREYQKNHPNTFRVNKDDLRSMLFGKYWSKQKEKIVLEIRDKIIDICIKNDYDILVDDTNLSPKHESRIVSLFSKYAEIEIVDDFLSVPLSECIERDYKREENSVGSKVITDMYDAFVKDKKMDTKKCNIWKNESAYAPVPYDHYLPDCYIIDVDGTLALHTTRSPYDTTKVNEDVVNLSFIRFLNSIYNDFPERIIVSGREGTRQCYEDTYSWLKKNNIEFDHLYMRKELDHRKDVIVKKEIYEEYIRGKYNVLAVFDDRNQTVKGWRELGLLCLQVADGNF